ncbi:hypothetical protein [Phocaeicola dorei]|uniref:hypothetical protein n=1 Tax=Phocaeicola dorei TaxID=357276 RepID=UPI0032C0E8AC
MAYPVAVFSTLLTLPRNPNGNLSEMPPYSKTRPTSGNSDAWTPAFRESVLPSTGLSTYLSSPSLSKRVFGLTTMSAPWGAFGSVPGSSCGGTSGISSSGESEEQAFRLIINTNASRYMKCLIFIR